MNHIALTHIPVIDYSKCIQCGECMAVCPDGVIERNYSSSCAKCMKYCITMKVPCRPDLYIFHYNRCNACGKCIAVCPSGALCWWDNPEAK